MFWGGRSKLRKEEETCIDIEANMSENLSNPSSGLNQEPCSCEVAKSPIVPLLRRYAYTQINFRL